MLENLLIGTDVLLGSNMRHGSKAPAFHLIEDGPENAE